MFSTYKEIWKIVQSNINFLQIIAFSVSAFIGVFVILLAVYCFIDFKSISPQESGIFKEEFVVISKKVSTLNSVMNRPAAFNDREIKNIRSQDFFTDIAQFTSSRFHIHMYTDNESMPLRTDLFFETVPDKYINQDPSVWVWEKGQNHIPIIIPENFISLYNFGFAPSQGLPQLSKDLIRKITFNIRITGKGKQEIYRAQIVDFSQRINTVLVPENFLKWANGEFGTGEHPNPSRLIVESKNIADSQIFEYISLNNFQINDNSLVNSKLSFYLKLTISIVASIGLIITILAILLLLFSFYLILEKNKTTLKNIWYLGFTHQAILLPYNIISFISLIIIISGALIMAHVTNSYILKFLQDFVPIDTIPIYIPIVISIGLYIGIIGFNYISLRRTLQNIIS
ncbi:MAG: hypothetical protein PF481_01720 [Bacteroidales bacterium]|jgi:hypothetical protein|nr:hypothetical protein [Bacteroidales bacterium]